MKPYKHIQDSKKVLKSLISEAKTMDNVKTRLTELNVLIKLVNSFDEMLNKKYYTEFFDILLLRRMAMYFSYHEVYRGEGVPLDQYGYELNRDLRFGREMAVNFIVDQLQTHQLANNLKKDKIKYDSKESLEIIVEKYLLDVKQKIQWDIKWKK